MSEFQLQVSGCVLAGGQSRRMGRDKAMLAYRGRPLVEHALGLVREAGCVPVVIAGSRGDLREYAPVVEDLHPGCGPLSGIGAALAAAAGDSVAFLAVDVPLVPPGLLRLLVERAERTGALVTMPVAGGQAQPLCAVYRRELLGGVTAALEAGDYKVMRVLESLTTERQRDIFGLEAVLAARAGADGGLGGWGLPGELVEAPHRWFANINTVDEYVWLAGAGKEQTGDSSRTLR